MTQWPGDWGARFLSKCLHYWSSSWPIMSKFRKKESIAPVTGSTSIRSSFVVKMSEQVVVPQKVIRITFRMAPPLFHKFLQKGISHWGKLLELDTLFHIEWKSGGAMPIWKLFPWFFCHCFNLFSSEVSKISVGWYHFHFNLQLGVWWSKLPPPWASTI